MKINIGCDLVCIPRFKKALKSRRFIERVFNEAEQRYCESKLDSAASYAARFGAKEAFAKALGTGLFSQGVSPRDIWVTNEANGKPTIVISGKLKEKIELNKTIGWDVSLSHHVDYAIANVVLYSA